MKTALEILVCVLICSFASYSTRADFRQQQVPVSKATQIDDEPVYKGKEVDKKVVVKSKPEPDYTDEARNHNIEGKVVIRCIFASSGEIKNLHVIKGLSYGLTESAIEAAKKIKFKPAMKNGKAVSVWMELQYNFWL